jgi:hypothetical protein
LHGDCLKKEIFTKGFYSIFQNAIPGLPPSTGEAALTKDKQEDNNKSKKYSCSLLLFKVAL